MELATGQPSQDGWKKRKRVRPAARKRGSRGKGSKKKEQESNFAACKKKAASEGDGSQSGSGKDRTADPMNVSTDASEGPGSHKRKRTRERKNRKWKPYSEMTWQERLEQEKRQEERAEAQERAENERRLSESTGKRKKKKRKTDILIDMPKAPRNPTQNLMHAQSASAEDEKVGATPVPSMQGLLSRRMMSFRNEDSSDEEGGEGDGHDQNGGAVTPVSGVLSDEESPQAERVNGAMTESEKDRRIRMLEEENRELRERLAALEREKGGSGDPPT